MGEVAFFGFLSILTICITYYNIKKLGR
jgi:hypothetical protein